MKIEYEGSSITKEVKIADSAICKQCRDPGAMREFATRFAHGKQRLESLFQF